MKSICDLWCYFSSSCCIRVTSWFESQKNLTAFQSTKWLYM